jgi:hypothetical protein
VIGALQEVVMDMLKEFHRRNNGRKPQALIYYRDGVADSQFPTVLEHEYTAFRRVRGGGVEGVGGWGRQHHVVVLAASLVCGCCSILKQASAARAVPPGCCCFMMLVNLHT